MKTNKLIKTPLLTLLLFKLFFLCHTLSFSAPMYFVPVTLKQPDGEIIHCFASGDEFYNWVHDKDNYTIIKDHSTGFYVYALKEGDDLIPSKFIAGKCDPEKTGLQKGLNISQKMIQEIKKNALKHYNSTLKTNNYKAGNLLNNIVIFIRFSDEAEFVNDISSYDSLFNNRMHPSLYSYYNEVSYNQFRINSTFYPKNSNILFSYKDSHPRAYYQIYDSVSNPIGYIPNPYDPYAQAREQREFQLLYDCINSLNDQIPTDLNVDADGDDNIDNVTFVISGSIDTWTSLLWPHRWALWGKYAYVNNRYRVYNYNFQLQNSLSVTVLCHEMFHTLGAPDLYHYDSPYNELSPCSVWDIMDRGSAHMSAYMKWKYGKWIPEIPEIFNSGVFSLSSLVFSPNCAYKIKSPASDSEYFIVEYRKKFGQFESNLPGDGLLVYRINPNRSGNEHGPPDEIYLFRPGGAPNHDGSPYEAFLSKSSGRIVFGDSLTFKCFLSNGLPGGLRIRVGDFAGSSEYSSIIYFTVEAPKNDYRVNTSTFSWIDISKSGKIINDWKNGKGDLSSTLDNGWTTIPMGMTFHYYDKDFDSINVGVNGLVSFTQKILNSAAKYGPTGIDSIGYYDDSYRWPGNELFPNSIAAAYADFDINSKDPYGGGRVIYGNLDNKFVITWENLGSFEKAHDTTNSFQIVLDKSNNSISVQFKKIGSETIRKKIKTGIQKDSQIGLSWVNSGIPVTHIPSDSSAIIFVPNILSIVKDETAEEKIAGFKLNQNYPNPFNPNTIISFAIPTDGFVTLKLYDILGKEVRSLINEYKKNGNYRYTFNGNNLSSGIYFYTLKVDPSDKNKNYIQTRKMVLVK
jgi:M6 family metalloprotease-like protein